VFLNFFGIFNFLWHSFVNKWGVNFKGRSDMEVIEVLSNSYNTYSLQLKGVKVDRYSVLDGIEKTDHVRI